jgi:hypothetical protein
MKFSSTLFLIVFGGFFIGCDSKQTAAAKIFERREVEGNKLMIKYAFTAKGQSIIDSTILDNKVLNSDSISITFDPSNPSDNSLQLPK